MKFKCYLFFLSSQIEKLGTSAVCFKFCNGSLTVTIRKSDLTKEICDAIVNPTSVSMKPSGGLDSIVHAAAGSLYTNQVQAVSNGIEEPACPVGQSRIFVARNSANPKIARFIINTVGPSYENDTKDQAAFDLQSCYQTSMALANQYSLSSIAYPAISCGANHYPPNDAAQVAIESVRKYSNNVKDIRFILFDSVIFNSFVQEWTNYAEKINAETSTTRERVRPETRLLSSKSTDILGLKCTLCEEQPLTNNRQYLCTQCFSLTRSELFDKFLDQLRSAAQISYDQLCATCKLFDPIFKLYPFLYTPIQKFDQSIHKRDSAAEYYLQNHCDSKFRNAMPMAIVGDGNCFYNTFVNLGGVGTAAESFSVTSVELRARNIVELVLHLQEYTTKYKSFSAILDNFEKYVREEMVYDKNYTAAWDFLSIATVLNINIRSIYPRINGVDDQNYQALNDKLFEPVRKQNSNQSNKETSSIYEVRILFSNCNKPVKPVNNNKTKGWMPNHFVPLLNLR